MLAVAADVTQQADVGRMSATVHGAWGGLDLLCHCAGRSMRGTVLATSPEDFEALWNINFLSAVRCVQAFASSLAENRGHFVLIGSLASKVAAGYLGAYPASKFPLAALAQQLRIETEQSGLHTLLVCPDRSRAMISLRRATVTRIKAAKFPRPHTSQAAGQRYAALIRIFWRARFSARANIGGRSLSCRGRHDCCSRFPKSRRGSAIGCCERRLLDRVAELTRRPKHHNKKREPGWRCERANRVLSLGSTVAARAWLIRLKRRMAGMATPSDY